MRKPLCLLKNAQGRLRKYHGRIGEPGDEIQWGIYETFFTTLKLFLSHRITLVAEAAFQHRLWAPKLEPLQEIARVRIVLCTVSPELARSRGAERWLADPDRGPLYIERVVKPAREGQELSIGNQDPNYDPPHLELPTLTVDTYGRLSTGFRRDRCVRSRLTEDGGYEQVRGWTCDPD